MKSLFFMVFFSLPFQLMAQDVFYVTVVRGNVYRQNNSKVQFADKLSGNERLKFTSKEDILIVLNTKGRYEISVSNKKNVKSNELTNLVIKDNIHIHADNIRLSSRAIGDEISLSDYFKPAVVNGKEVNEKILIADELKISTRNMGYANVNNKENFFFLQLIDTGKNGVNKKLKARNDSLFFSREDFMFNGKLYSTGDGILKLGFVEGYSGEKKVKEIGDIKPVFISKAELGRAVHAIKISLPGLPKDEIINEIYTQLYFFYGKPDMQLIEHLYYSHL